MKFRVGARSGLRVAASPCRRVSRARKYLRIGGGPFPGGEARSVRTGEQTADRTRLLVLGIGNILMGDEGIGVEVVRQLAGRSLPSGVTCLDGGTGGFNLLGPMQEADHVVLVDATVDGAPVGSVRRLRPRYSTDYPRTLTAHDVGLKDLLDVFYLLGDPPEVTLFAVSIAPLQDMRLGLSAALAARVPAIAAQIQEEIRCLLAVTGPS